MGSKETEGARKKRLIVIVGATGSGKTDLSIRLAKRLGAAEGDLGGALPILSTDSRQVYRGMAIGTAQPTFDQLQEAEHHFVAEFDLKQHFSCGEYEIQALERLARLFEKHDTVVAVGGSGLYVQALCEGMDALPAADVELRESLTRRLEAEGLASLCEQLAKLDPVYYEQVDRNNPARVVRALEVCLQTGKPYSSFRTGGRVARDFSIIKIGIEMDRPTLYARIDRRVEAMMADGLEQEARAIWEAEGGALRRLNALQTVGYRELFDYFEGRCTLAEAVELIKRNSRRYAKRQLTWFRRDPAVFWATHEQEEEIRERIARG